MAPDRLHRVVTGVRHPQELNALVAAAVDNLTREKVPQKVMPLNSVPGRFRTSGEEDDEYLSPENFQRYEPYVRLLESLNSSTLVAQYVRLYPLFQEAFEKLATRTPTSTITSWMSSTTSLPPPR